MVSVYHNSLKLCDSLKNNYHVRGCNLFCDFTIEEGRKYYKIIHVSENQRSVHAFVDKKTGDIYKPAGWNGPAKGVRFNLLNDLENVLTKCDWAGSYLYR